MGMSTHIEGFIPDTDKEYLKHKEILEVCAKNEVTLPKETAEYFGEEYPQRYLLDEKLAVILNEGIHYTKYSADGSDGFEVDLTKLPKGVTKLRFYNSW